MSASYSASERRGILIVALIALIIIGAGLFIAYFERHQPDDMKNTPQIVEISEYIDTVSNNYETEKTTLNKKQKSLKKKNSKKTSKGKAQKTYRRRNPLEEPVKK